MAAGGKTRVELLRYGNVVASREVDVPMSRDAAVAQLTVVVSELVQSIETASAGGDWRKVFPKAALLAKFSVRTVHVASAGQASKELSAAAAALLASYRRAKVTASAKRYGERYKSNVELCRRVVKDLKHPVVVVRVFDTGGINKLAVVSAFNTQCELEVSFSAGPERPLAGGEDVESGVSRSVAASVMDASDDRAKRAKKRIEIRESIFSDGQTLVTYHDAKGRRLEYPDVFSKIGRTDLENSWRRRERMRFIGGFLGFLGSVGLTAGLILSADGQESDVAFTGGTVCLVTGVLIVATLGRRIDDSTARPAVEDFNRKLGASSKRKLRLAPYAQRNGGGLMMGGMF